MLVSFVERNLCFAVEDTEKGPSFPFPTEPDDHCESPLLAYNHVVAILKLLCQGQQPEKSTIYDPYYCNGAVVRNLNQLGFPNVYNVKQDCYAAWQKQELPSFDILLTNPPYSVDHVSSARRTKPCGYIPRRVPYAKKPTLFAVYQIEKLMKFVTSSYFGNRPWMLLLPNWVHKKDYYVEATKKIRPFYLVPRKRYVYEPPKEFRQAKKSDVHKKSSPFVSMWYIWGGDETTNKRLIRHILQSSTLSGSGNSNPLSECDLARSKSALRDLRRKKR